MTSNLEIMTYNDLKVVKPVPDEGKKILTPESLKFLSDVVEKFSSQIGSLLEERRKVQQQIDEGDLPDFPDETKKIRNSDWKASPMPDDLLDRSVEITGPVDRKMIINALNSGANVFMADFEDSNSPTWENIINGQINLYDAVRKTIEFTKSDGSKHYSLNDDIAILMVRPRGLHLVEEGIVLDGKPVPGALVDFSLFFFHNAQELIKQNKGPYFYIPKLQHYLEARLWNDIFIFAQDYLEIPQGTIKATVLLEHILAAFQMDEILYELKEHSAGLNSGRWDYIFSFIKTFSNRSDFILPDRNQLGMDRHFLKSYVKLLIQTCHKRGVSAMGGMAAQIPIKGDPKKNEEALEKVRQDKIREVNAGHDGTWVAHPGLINIAKSAFQQMDGTHQLHIIPEETILPGDLLKIPDGTITQEGIRTNINVGLRYLASWLSGQGCVPIFNLMEDAATAEISRSQLWQWVKHQATLEDGNTVNEELFLKLLSEEKNSIKQEIGEKQFETGNFELAAKIFKNLTLRDEMPEFLTIEAYQHLP